VLTTVHLTKNNGRVFSLVDAVEMNGFVLEMERFSERMQSFDCGALMQHP
jgi:hypothetical protein